jgi:hypothetical protein
VCNAALTPNSKGVEPIRAATRARGSDDRSSTFAPIARASFPSFSGVFRRMVRGIQVPRTTLPTEYVMQTIRHRFLLAAALGAIVQFHAGATLATESDNADVIASQIRRQGVACTTPRNASRDPENSIALEAAWILHCNEASYRVTLVPHLGARISPMCREAQPEASDGRGQ